MDNRFYNEIFKRKSFHLFRGVGSDKIDPEELSRIEEAYEGFEKLYPEIRTAIRIVPAKQVSFKRDAEYCIMIYSEKRDNYLINAGYIGEQLDLYLVSRNIGTLWFGIGKPDLDKYDGLDYVIMIAIHKLNDEKQYRKDMFKAKRKPLDEIWSGNALGVADIVRFAPSACNTQPWFVKNDGKMLTVFRYKKPGKRGIMPANAVSYFNRIDIGIFLCFLDICLAEKKITFTRELFTDEGDLNTEYSKVAEYSFREPVVEVVAALIWDGPRFMICQRPATKARALLWEFVGGKIEPGETKEQALIRECREELAITLSVGDLYMDVIHEYPDIKVHLSLFNASIASGTPQLLEHNDLKWITVDEIPGYRFCPADTEILNKLKGCRNH